MALSDAMVNRLDVERVTGWGSGVNKAPVYAAPVTLLGSVQPASASVVDRLGRPLDRTVYEILLDVDPEVKHQDRVTVVWDPDDRTRDEVLGVLNRATDDAGRGVLWILLCERVK